MKKFVKFPYAASGSGLKGTAVAIYDIAVLAPANTSSANADRVNLWALSAGSNNYQLNFEGITVDNKNDYVDNLAEAIVAKPGGAVVPAGSNLSISGIVFGDQL
tara:strand:+ start:2558 stop:2869 length:312 start_codon:yes stop_codon:yes gene_type:complete